MSRWRPCWPPCPCTPSCGSGKFSQSSPRKALLRLPASAASLSAHQHPPPGCLEKVKQVTVFKQRRHVCQLRDEDQGTVPLVVPICRVRPSRPDVVRQVKRVAIAPSVVVSKRQSLWVLKWVMSQFSSQSCKAKSHLSHPCMPARPFLRPREGQLLWHNSTMTGSSIRFSNRATVVAEVIFFLLAPGNQEDVIGSRHGAVDVRRGTSDRLDRRRRPVHCVSWSRQVYKCASGRYVISVWGLS